MCTRLRDVCRVLEFRRCDPDPLGYRRAMSTHKKEPPVELPEAAHEEDISRADAAERLEKDPDEQVNYTDRPLGDQTHPEDT